MKKFFFWVLIILITFLLLQDAYQGVAFGIAIILFTEILLQSNRRFAFREWALLLYAINYLVAPAITYNLPDDDIQYGMKLVSDQYFELAIPGFLCLTMGMFIFKTKIFIVDFTKVNASSSVNEKFLVQITIIGILGSILNPFIQGELNFIFYLFSLVRFVGAFALFSLKSKNWHWVALVLILELIKAFLGGMYHDALMWLVFFALFFVYSYKPPFQVKLLGLIGLATLILFVQAIKSVYRDEVWRGNEQASLETVYDVGSKQANSGVITRTDNLLSTLNRGNQAWILASTVENMDMNKNYQGLTNVNKYLEAALLPRFLAPNKIKSGDKEIFNEFSGHLINENTSMGLGIFADGYIAYGAWGVYIFGFVLGLIFSLTFKLVERWTKVSPFYVLLLLPLLNYAVRPDCELQTTINHLFKGIFMYGFLVYLTRKRFTLDSQENQRKLLHLNLVTTKK
jgi:hypothetical protein